MAVLIAGATWYGMSATPAEPDLVPTTAQGAGTPAQGIVATLLTLRTVKLDGTIFSDPAFMGLQDVSTDIIAEPVGRPNPFAPLTSKASPSASSTKSAQIFTPARR